MDDVDVNMNMQKVTVMGWAEEKKVLKTVRRTGRKAELWPFSYTPEYQHNLNLQYNNNTQQYPSPTSLSNYYLNGFNNYDINNNNYAYDYHQNAFSNYNNNNNDHAYDYDYDDDYDYNYHYDYDYDQQAQPPYSTTSPFEYGEARSIFSDENPHACSIM